MPAAFVLVWSTGFIVARYGMPHAPPFGFLAIRYALSVLAFGLWIAAVRAPWPQGRAQWGHLAVAGVLMHAGYLGGVWAAVKAGMGAGMVALLVGLSMVVSRKLGAGEVNAANFALAVFALLSITIGTLYQKRFVTSGDVRTANAVQIAAALAVTLPLAVLEGGTWQATHPEFLGAMAWSVLVLTLGGSSMLYLLIQRGAAARVTSLLYLVPPCTAVMAWLLFGEALTALVLLGIAVTAVGVALVVREPSAPPAAAPTAQ